VKRAVKRLSLGTVLVAFAIGATACAESAAEPGTVESDVVTSAAATSGVTATDAASSPETTAPGDFGSRYNGSPVAFWFWAPY